MLGCSIMLADSPLAPEQAAGSCLDCLEDGCRAVGFAAPLRDNMRASPVCVFFRHAPRGMRRFVVVLLEWGRL